MKSKHLIHIILFLIFVSDSMVSVAQGNYLRWGMKIGGNISDFIGPDSPPIYDYGWGWSSGLYTDYRITDNMSIWTEVNYLQRSVQFSEEIKYVTGGHMVINEKNEFLNVPVFLKFRQDNEIFNANLGFGLSTSILARKNRDIKVYIDDFLISTDPFYSSTPTWVDYGANAVATIHFRAFFIDFNYYMSLRNIFQGEDAREMRYQTGSVSLGYEFNHPEPFRQRKRRYSAKQRFKYKMTHLFK